jgi:hypothetical protein
MVFWPKQSTLLEKKDLTVYCSFCPIFTEVHVGPDLAHLAQ